MALVTGASSGIGKAIAFELAASGINLILCARSEHILHQLKLQLEKDYAITVYVAAFDLHNYEEVNKLILLCNTLRPKLSVLAAGFGTSGLFVKNNIADEVKMLRVNVEAVLRLTHYFAQIYKAQQQGGIILFSSLVAFQGVPNAANYAASKAYIQALGEAIALELKPFNVDILTAAPGPVQTGFGKRADMKLGISANADEVAYEILNALGKQSSVRPGLLTKVMFAALATAPRFLKVRIMGSIMAGFTKHQLSNT